MTEQLDGSIQPDGSTTDTSLLPPSHQRLLDVTDQMFRDFPEESGTGDQQGIFFLDTGAEDVLLQVQAASFGDVLVKGDLSIASLQPGIAVAFSDSEHEQQEKDPEGPVDVSKGRSVSIYFGYDEGSKSESHSITLEGKPGGSGPLKLTGVNISHDSSAVDDSDKKEEKSWPVRSEEEAIAFIDLVKGLYKTWKDKESPSDVK